MIDFMNKVVLVTGGGAGIGLETATAFGRLGAKLAVLDIDPQGVKKARDQLESEGVESLVVEGDAADKETVERLAARIEAKFGKLDVLVNNVGHSVTRGTKFANMSDEEIEATYRINLSHIFLVTRAMIPLLKKAGGDASIVNVSSIEGHRGIPNFVVYGAFKAAVTGFTASLALELAPEGIRVNEVAPETTESAQVDIGRLVHETQRHNISRWTPLGRFGKPTDSAGCILFLASPLAAWVTGTTIHVDGGAKAAGGWYRDNRSNWTNMPVIHGSSFRPAEK